VREPVRVLGVAAPGRAELLEEPRPEAPPGGFTVQMRYSGLSAGTELSFFKGTNPFLSAAWDADLGLFDPQGTGTGYPVERLGYMQVGEVIESRSDLVAPGRLVALTCGHREAYGLDPAQERFVVVPDDLDPLLGIYVAHMGPICANGILHAAAEAGGREVTELGAGVRGRRVLVVGAGVVGLLTALFARHGGAAEVVVADRSSERLAAARGLGADTLDLEHEDDPARGLKRRWRVGPGDAGADVAFQCRGQPEALAFALRAVRPQSTVIDLAFYQGGAAEVRLGEEFHHNGLALRCAQIGRVPAGLAPAWTRERLSHETIGMLRAHGAAVLEHIITDVVAFADAPAVIADLAARRRQPIQAVFAMGAEREMTSS